VADAEHAWGRSLLSLVHAEPSQRRDRACGAAGEWRGLRTPAWYLLRSPEGTRELFAKPDDRWEANEVSDRCQSIVDDLERVLDEFQHCAEAGRPQDLPPLPETLTNAHT
jgi:hypothetical protein